MSLNVEVGKSDAPWLSDDANVEEGVGVDWTGIEFDGLELPPLLSMLLGAEVVKDVNVGDPFESVGEALVRVGTASKVEFETELGKDVSVGDPSERVGEALLKVDVASKGEFETEGAAARLPPPPSTLLAVGNAIDISVGTSTGLVIVNPVFKVDFGNAEDVKDVGVGNTSVCPGEAVVIIDTASEVEFRGDVGSMGRMRTVEGPGELPSLEKEGNDSTKVGDVITVPATPED